MVSKQMDTGSNPLRVIFFFNSCLSRTLFCDLALLVRQTRERDGERIAERVRELITETERRLLREREREEREKELLRERRERQRSERER